MKREFNFYKSWYAGFRFKDLIPLFGFSKNVQGWSFTRNWTLNWFTYCLQFSIVLRSDITDNGTLLCVARHSRYFQSITDTSAVLHIANVMVSCFIY